MNETSDVRRRAARADLHLLPPGALARRAGRPHAAHARRTLNRRDRTRVPRPVRDDEQAPDPRQAQDPRRCIPFAVPPDHLLPERLDAVLAVVYLIFNEGWGGGRIDLSTEAIRLGRALIELMPDESEVHRAARIDADRTTRAGTPACATGSWSCSISRTARCGISNRSRKLAGCSNARVALRGEGPT